MQNKGVSFGDRFFPSGTRNALVGTNDWKGNVQSEAAYHAKPYRSCSFFAAFLSFTSAAIAQERDWHEVSVQSTAVFTKDTDGNGITQHTSDSGGLLVNYRFHFNRWLAAEANYGYDRNTHRYMTVGGLEFEQ